MQFPKQSHLYLYNKDHIRQTIKDPRFYFFGSGSTGNSVYLKDSHLLIDLGFPYSHYHDVSPYFFYDVRYVLLTHEHSDHLNMSTLFHLLDLYPHLKFMISRRMYDRLINPLFGKNFPNDRKKREHQKQLLASTYQSHFQIMEPDQNTIEIYQNDLNLKPVKIKPHLVSHGDIFNVAYELWINGQHVLYSSDLDHVFAPQNDQTSLPLEYDQDGHVKMFTHPYDLIFLEANYDHDILKRFLGEHPEDAHAIGNLRHISEQETWQYIKYALKPAGIFVPLHASQEFGTLVQNLK